MYMPAAADAGPAAFMRWLKEYGGGGPPTAKIKDPFVGHTPTGDQGTGIKHGACNGSVIVHPVLPLACVQ
jgi:hypothetical protein